MFTLSCPFSSQRLSTPIWSLPTKIWRASSTSIDQERFVSAWLMLLDFLRPHMDVSDNEAFSVYPGKTNNKPGDIIKGRTFRGLNVTRKIIVKDVPHLIRSALDMQTFALGQKCISQCRGSPMGSPLSPALCLMVVSISEQVWSITVKQTLSNHNLFIRHIRYAWSSAIHASKTWHHMTSSWTMASMENPSSWKPLSPFLASPPQVLLSGFRSHCHIVVKGAFPDPRVKQGLDQLIRLYTLAGFPKEELQTISHQIMIQHQNLSRMNKKLQGL